MVSCVLVCRFACLLFEKNMYKKKIKKKCIKKSSLWKGKIIKKKSLIPFLSLCLEFVQRV